MERVVEIVKRLKPSLHYKCKMKSVESFAGRPVDKRGLGGQESNFDNSSTPVMLIIYVA